MNSGKDHFITLPTKDDRLKPFVSYFYFHHATDEIFNKSFTFYPNYKHAITAYASSKSIKIGPSTHKIIPHSNVNVLYTMNYDKAYQVNLNGAFSKLGIVFHPLGINHFIKPDLDKIYNIDNQYSFHYFGNEFDQVLQSVFDTDSYELKQEILEQFLISKLQPFDQPLLKQAIDLMFDNQSNLKIEEIASILNTNRKQLLRLFQKHVCCSPEIYRKMIRFRNAFNELQTDKESTLTDISLFHNYYDQSDFNRQFKSITNEQPKNLLKSITHIGNEDTYWKFEELTKK
jgi:AraC-like DNA-binding protein